jgi:arabinogalactan endo-1,4-beta-galactosidase
MFIEGLAASLRAVPDTLGLGYVYWEPLWLPSARFGSPVDNLTLFDPAGTALPALYRLR